MTSRPKQKLTTLPKQDALLETFYNELDESEESFVGNRPIDENDIDDDYELQSGSDNNDAEHDQDLTRVEHDQGRTKN